MNFVSKQQSHQNGEHLPPAPLPPRSPTLLPLALTAVFIGYFLPWLAHPTAGLTLIGLDVSEWVKFLPQMQAGQLPNRDWFYLPPITLGLALVWLSAGQIHGRWRPWLLRGLGLLVSLLAFPALEAIRFEDASQWRPRLMAIALVGLAAVLSPWLPQRWAWFALVATSLLGLLLPTWAVLAVRPVVSELLRDPVGIGLGVYANAVGHGVLAVVGWGRGGRE